MRAGVLSNDQNIEFLNKNFINTWVENAELGRIPSLRKPIAKRRERESKIFDTTDPLAQAIMQGWNQGSPVDCLVISPEFEVMGTQRVNEIDNDARRKGLLSDEAYYLTFLKESLKGKFPGFSGNTSDPSLHARISVEEN